LVCRPRFPVVAPGRVDVYGVGDHLEKALDIFTGAGRGAGSQQRGRTGCDAQPDRLVELPTAAKPTVMPAIMALPAPTPLPEGTATGG
jgi:hypothetical protein